MTILVWSEDYGIGLADVDQQHQGLVDMINRLDDAIADGAPATVIARLLADLKAYTHYHFSAEEHLMRDLDCDSAHLRLHLRQHRDFERSLEQFARAYEVNGSVVAGSLLEFLLKWLMSHIMGSDKEMGRILRGEAEGVGGGSLSESERERWLQRQLDQEVAQRNMLNALREAESRFRIIADTAPVLIWMGDSGGGRSFFNRTWLEFTGRSADDAAGWGWLSDVHPEDRAGYLEIFRQALRGHHDYCAEFRLRRADGEFRWMVENGRPRAARNGAFAGFIGSTTDITLRKQAEQAIEQACVQLEQEATTRTAKVRQLARKLESIRGRLDGADEDLEPLVRGLMCEIDEALELVGACLPDRVEAVVG
jgi:hemerythrin-like metal-binding protein/PAS domain S-box-containing protein